MQTITVNDIVIANAAIAREVQYQDAPSPRAAWDAATRALIVRELLLQRARKLALTADPQTQDGARETDEEALIRALLEAEVRTPTADDAACRRYYQANPARFRSPDLFEPVHLLFKAPRDEQAAYGRAVERAEAVLAEVQAHPDRFESLARSLSDCPSASEGGRLGQIVRGETTPEFEAVLLSLQPGQIAPAPVRTRYGVHVLRLERKVAGAVLPFEQVRDRIAAYLEENAWRRAVAQYVALLAGQARIEGFDMPGATSPLVQ
ncbi:peptidylprolyl isomerase [Limobrevibacterium gyesilva]|uniref:Parvulin-like PPIase n=1 Tax=Limobrevibacterium gyesilva TaxID=2991712 RepID=A0AA41YPU8_9PROT|nr:peptidylprolyl isomerase [Limobrevibacterium gyesilva]MCW3476362.1 peptidylprolyl isomerase [Limobrevibacterium gyesilva]